MKELFYVSSIIERFQREDTLLKGGVIHWFVPGSTTRRNAHPDLIEGYENMNRAQRVYCEEFLDELLTAPEVVKLAGFLSTIQDDGLQLAGDVGDLLLTRRVELPVSGQQVGYRHMPLGGGTSRFVLNRHEKYNLPFEVQGYVDVTEDGLDDRMDVSVQYVRRALQALDVDAGIKLSQIESVVKALYSRDALYVTDASNSNILENVQLLN